MVREWLNAEEGDINQMCLSRPGLAQAHCFMSMGLVLSGGGITFCRPPRQWLYSLLLLPAPGVALTSVCVGVCVALVALLTPVLLLSTDRCTVYSPKKLRQAWNK